MQAILVKVLKGISGNSSKCKVYDNDIHKLLNIQSKPKTSLKTQKMHFCLF